MSDAAIAMSHCALALLYFLTRVAEISAHSESGPIPRGVGGVGVGEREEGDDVISEKRRPSLRAAVAGQDRARLRPGAIASLSGQR